MTISPVLEKKEPRVPRARYAPRRDRTPLMQNSYSEFSKPSSYCASETPHAFVGPATSMARPLTKGGSAAEGGIFSPRATSPLPHPTRPPLFPPFRSTRTHDDGQADRARCVGA